MISVTALHRVPDGAGARSEFLDGVMFPGRAYLGGQSEHMQHAAAAAPGEHAMVYSDALRHRRSPAEVIVRLETAWTRFSAPVGFELDMTLGGEIARPIDIVQQAALI